MLIVPAQIDGAIGHFAQRIARTNPIRIDVLPRPDAEPFNCGVNVDLAIAADGGVARKGWRVWWIPNVLIEAQAHVVWQQADGAIIDITPNEDHETECVFIHDSAMTANPGVDYVPSEHENLTNNSDVDRYIECARIVSDHRDHVFPSGIPTLLPDANELARLQGTLAQLAAENRG